MRIVQVGCRRLAAMTMLCAGVVAACGDDDEPSRPAGTGGETAGEGGSESSGGETSSGGAGGSGGSSTGGTSSGGAESGGAASGGAASGGTSSGGGSAGGATGGSPSAGGTGAGGSTAGGTGGITDTTPSVTGPATTTSDGVLTSLKGASFTKAGGSLVVTSFHAAIENLPSFDSIQLWGDVENRGTKVECIPLATLAIDGYDILTVVEGPTYKDSLTVSTDCLPPGGKGVFTGIDNEVSATLLAAPNSVTYSFTTLSSTSAVPHPALPTVTNLRVDHSTGLYAVAGTMTAVAAIYNVGIDILVRDSSGLLREKLNAFPGQLEALSPGSQTAFKSNGVVEPFQRYEYFIDFIEGTGANFTNPSARLHAERSRLVNERFDAAASARKALRKP